MIRLSTLFWLVLVSATGFTMFAVKYQVQTLADELAQTTRRADGAEHEIRVLDAEWAYLNRPSALAQMNQHYLTLVPIATKQLRTSVADIPLRPTPPPPTPSAPPIVTIAAASVPSVASASPSQSAPVNQAAGSSLPRPLSSGAPVVIAALETRVPASEPARAAPPKAVARPSVSRRVKSLDALIAQITESR